MKTIKATLGALLLAATILGAQQASATPITYRDADQISMYLDSTGGSAPTSYSSTFNFVSPDGTGALFAVGFGAADGIYKSQLGFQPGVQSVAPGSGIIKLFLRDPKGGSETGTVTVLNLDLIDIMSFKTYTILTSTFAGSISAQINSTGIVNYTITATSGELYVRGAYAQFSVPDGGTTAALLGCSLLGLALLRRRFAPVAA